MSIFCFVAGHLLLQGVTGHTVIVRVPCGTMAHVDCVDCCIFSSQDGGPALGRNEAKKLAGVSGVGHDRVLTQSAQRGDGRFPCAQLSYPDCLIYDKRPFVCRTYPLMLYQGQLVLSIRCPYVTRILLPKWGCEGMSPEDEQMFYRLQQEMAKEIPGRIQRMWDQDITELEVVVTLNVAPLISSIGA